MKFKRKQTKKLYKKTKSKDSRKFPSFYRYIPEHLNKDETIFLFGFVVILGAILLISLDLYATFTKQKNLINERSRTLNEISFWENELRNYPGYRDGYFKLAILNFQLKNFGESQKNLDKVIELDPNFKEGRELEKLLDNF